MMIMSKFLGKGRDMEPAGLRGTDRTERCLEDNLRSSAISDTSYDEFETIDWAAAAPPWSSIVAGVTLPVLATAVLIFLINVALCLVFESWIGHFKAVPFWLLLATLFPVALVGTVTLTKLFWRISIIDWMTTRSKEVL